MSDIIHPPAEIPRNGGIMNIERLIAAAIEKGTPLDSLKDILDFQRGCEKDQAARDFAAALKGFQAEAPRVEKTRQVLDKNGNKIYKFAPFEDIMQQIGRLLDKWGIVPSFSFSQTTAGLMLVTCTLRVGIHTQDSTLPMPVPASAPGGINEAQRYGIAQSYAKRYALVNALNIVTCGEDTDGHGAGDRITEAQAAKLWAMIQDKKADMQRFLKWAGIEKLEDMPASFYQKAEDTLIRKAST